MNVYTCTDHDGFYPVGVASVIVASNEHEAREVLSNALADGGLDHRVPFTLTQLNTHVPNAVILCDGDY